ncbi:Ger(x)C family spore germination C-terminal domain-containing protein [Alkalihalobacterium elongatum]|uniref:Ger(x)C family spore germination C-terminal domain-containing protein n=1 Tax=Alkalihalobacterium elongatum TaxID=2675466 RepID=UPI001C1F5F63|nr:Ger(x)C family spore germination C-terminal domain-containing protein [Alkalihalobacterium elongatum]
MQAANCDGFGIGRRLMAFHLEKWEQYNWAEVYPNIKINPNVTVEVMRHGILN